MRAAGILAGSEVRRMVWSKTSAIFAGLYWVSFMISAVFFKIMGSDGSVLTLGNAQSFPVQHLQASFLLTGTFLAVYTGQMISQDRSQGTIKLILTRSVSRLEYYMGKLLSVGLLSLWLTFMMIALGYLTGLLFFGWGDALVFFSVQAGGWKGLAVTFLTGLAFAFSYFAFGMISMVVAMLADKVMETAVLLGIMLMAGQYFELLPAVKQFAVFHQMLFFLIDIWEQPYTYNVINAAVVIAYSAVFGMLGYFIFRSKDLHV